MNIFVTDPDAKKSAVALDDARLRKMIVESTQLLSTTVALAGKHTSPYKPTHANHPSTKWVRSSKANYLWLVSHLQYMCDEYRRRFNKEHKCEQYINYLASCCDDYPYEQIGLVEFDNCTPFKDQPVLEAYRTCLINKWKNDKRTPKWTNSRPPEWIDNENNTRS